MASIWVKNSVSNFPKFSETASTKKNYDTVVIGGGIAGVSTAHALKERGVNVALFEAKKIACGTTGNSTCKLTSLHRAPFNMVNENYGGDAIKHYVDINEYGIRTIAELAEKYQIDCEFEWKDNYTFTFENDHVQDLRNEYDLLKSNTELDVSLLEGDELNSLGLANSFTQKLKSAVKIANQAQFNAYAFTKGLAEAIHSDDTPVFEHTRIIDVSKSSPHTVRTENGEEIIANNVVITTHLPILDVSGHFGVLEPSASYGVVFSLQNENELPQGMYITSESPTRSLRTVYNVDKEPCLLVVGFGHHLANKDGEEQFRELENWTRENFKVKDRVDRFFAFDYMSGDRMPYIGYLMKSTNTMFTATGFNKWGLAFGVGAGKLISDLIVGEKNPWQGTFDSTRWNLSSTLKKTMQIQMDVGKHFVGDRLKDLTSILKPTDIEDLEPGSGCIIYKGTHPVAVHKDNNGEIHSVSAVCTHLGCHVRFNSGAKTWDCPCHGSRFSVDGDVISGPTVKRLKKMDY